MVANFTWWWAQTAKKKRISWLIMVFVRGAKIKNVRVCERNKWRLLSSHHIYTFVCIYEKKDNDRIQLKLCANLKARCQHCRNEAKWTWLLHIPELSFTPTELKIILFCVCREFEKTISFAWMALAFIIRTSTESTAIHRMSMWIKRNCQIPRKMPENWNIFLQQFIHKIFEASLLLWFRSLLREHSLWMRWC